MKVESFIGLVQVNYLSLQQMIQILVLQHRLTQNGRMQKYGDQKLVETPSKFAIFSMENPVISDLLLGSGQFSSSVFHDCRLKFSKQKQNLSYFESFQSHPKGIYKVMTLNLYYQGKHFKETRF